MPVIPFAFEPNQHIAFSDTFPSSYRLEKTRSNALLVSAQKGSLNCNNLPIDREWQSVISLLMDLLAIAPKVPRDCWQNTIVPDAEKSEQVIQVVRMIALGQEVFGEATYFNTWLLKPAYGLMGKLPLELFYTEGGIDLITDELIRIAHGDAIL